MGIKFTKDSYLMQSKLRIEDPQVGYLLKDIYNLEQILVTNKAQFLKFYRLYKGESQALPDDLSMDEINRWKVEIIKETMEDMVKRMNGGVYDREGAII